MLPLMDERYRQIRAQLSAEGGPFETREEWVLGEAMQVFAKRHASLRELLAASAAFGDAEYIVNDERRISYSEHLRLVGSVARGLQERHGVGPGDRVAILAANCPEWIIAYWATVSLGAIVASLNGWWTRDEILYALELSEPTLLLGDRKRLERVRDDVLDCQKLEIEADFAALEAHAADAPLPAQEIAEDDAAVILFTSGTTGRPKGAVNTHRGIVGFAQTNAMTGLERILHDVDPDAPPPSPPGQTITLATPPLFHLSGLYGLTVMMTMVGGKLVLRGGRFDPEDVLRTIERERVTQWTAMGSSGPRLASHPDVARYDLSSVTNVGFGGAPASPALQARMLEIFPSATGNAAMGYGSSESVAVAAAIGGKTYRAHPESCGFPPHTVSVEIRDTEGKPLPEGVEGEIHTRSPYLMREYWRNPEATGEALLPGRWLATGDMGRIKDGLLYINSRARDMILRSAENVYPVEIEYRLDAHPAVRESAVIGIDHPELGQEVKAVVVPEPGAQPDVGELEAFCRETLAAYKVPSAWEIREDPLPRNAAGQVLKPQLS